ncbi:hypothetical protein EIN_444170 [Entamoeba invadens IP1]|uniref:Uncharacterized protein n=1 Tax=Entamoeba invadens IP1 TaxID=370355 RepID=A0A0A1UB39_ENTIV|nr:hypothetical protein EIN_444170 [Entamoeba invadens IP1]ELP92387.1 hypothetical protein EIN_444170 [Entamoeba invadens IP1]|eukprot:XP_004259158.1 hypothetical protein EIN_444170 [Entamoeba invadens IP1]
MKIVSESVNSLEFYSIETLNNDNNMDNNYNDFRKIEDDEKGEETEFDANLFFDLNHDEEKLEKNRQQNVEMVTSEEELFNYNEEENLFNRVQKEKVEEIKNEFIEFENHTFKIFKTIGMKEVDIDELSETIRRFSYIENNKKKRQFSLNHYIVAFDSMFSGEFKSLNKRELGLLVVKQRKMVDYIINEITNRVAMSASDKKAIKLCIEISFAGLSRNSLNRAKTLAISQKTGNQIIGANEKERKNREAQKLEHECVAISVDSTTKDDIEIICDDASSSWKEKYRITSFTSSIQRRNNSRCSCCVVSTKTK